MRFAHVGTRSLGQRLSEQQEGQNFLILICIINKYLVKMTSRLLVAHISRVRLGLFTGYCHTMMMMMMMNDDDDAYSGGSPRLQAIMDLHQRLMQYYLAHSSSRGDYSTALLG